MSHAVCLTIAQICKEKKEKWVGVLYVLPVKSAEERKGALAVTGKAGCYKPNALGFIRLGATISLRGDFFLNYYHHLSSH